MKIPVKLNKFGDVVVVVVATPLQEIDSLVKVIRTVQHVIRLAETRILHQRTLDEKMPFYIVCIKRKKTT